MVRKVVTSKDITSSGPYSHAVESGDLLFFSGQTAFNAVKKMKPNMTIKEETSESFKNLQSVMNEAQVSFDDVVKVNVYLTSMSDFEEMNQVYESIFNSPYPARTCVAVSELPLGAKIEVEVIARKKIE